MVPTKPFRATRHDDKRFRFLEEGMSVHTLAERARAAGVAFLQGTTGGWSSHDLALWLIGMYEPAAVRVGDGASSAPSSSRRLEHETLERVVLTARARVFAMLENTSSWRGETFAKNVVDAGLVVGVRDAFGGIGYAAVACDPMRLVDRVASLFVADYLTRPADYAIVETCEECGAIAFDGRPVHAHWCESPPNESSIVALREQRKTMHGL
ncbi:MAG TPA: hypothetical protein VIF62_14715 [Labilithrix sp.]